MGFLSNYCVNLAYLAAGQQPQRPLMFSYYVTHRCLLNCGYCCDGDGKRFKEDPVGELSTRDAMQLISIMSRAADTLDITGGEPLLRHDIEELLAHAQREGMRTVLNTKAIGLESRPDLVRYSNVLVLSIDALDPEPLSCVIGRSESEAHDILSALRFALAEHRKYRTKLVLSTVASPGSLDDAKQVLRFAEKHGLVFHISPQIDGTHVNAGLRNCDEYQSLIDEVMRLKRVGGRVLGVHQYFEGIKSFGSFPCHPMLMPVIRPDGKLYYPCLELKNAEVSVLEEGSYERALCKSRERFGDIPECGNCCHIFCHMAISLLQRHPAGALREMMIWRD